MCDEIGKDALQWQQQQDRLRRIEEEKQRMLDRLRQEREDLMRELERQRQEDEANRVAAELRLNEGSDDTLYDKNWR